ncbi:nucleoside-diphosphate sugar epimerase [Stenotrophomonas pictorum JCM 9942]|uniref:Nucleoside-diphosphate sugar epimerase n=2 Tax=Stenotrophomonas pictorum TaxID=86184 RepID=A0A0R0AH00_9GAMM|nr:mitochondrial fission ELM1 family protein [Stenotrophomonas pictorum]KRG44300.1 nucleoside-diphosphate sugar epimerase [Stenotrophomonas pictorum JCM 9942]
MPNAKRSTLPWTITDGRAGNVRQAVALASALRLGGQQRLQLEPRAPWRWLAPRLLPGATGGFGAGFERMAAAQPGLAIGCGRQAAGALRVLGRNGTRTVQILDPRIHPRHWDLVITPDHDRLRGDNVLTLLGSLNPVTDDWLACGRAAFSSFEHLPGPRTALLVGGPTDHAPWQQREIVPLFQALAAQVRAEGGSVLATTSRRTPRAVTQALLHAFDDVPGVIWSDGGDGSNPYAGLLGWADRVVCTPDSVNLLSEACATRVPVGVLLGRRAQGRMARFQQSLVERGRLLEGLAALDADPADPIEPLRETPRIAAEVKARLGL